VEINPRFVSERIGAELLKSAPRFGTFARPPRIYEVDNVDERILQVFLHSVAELLGSIPTS
jgi:hypothetical protein